MREKVVAYPNGIALLLLGLLVLGGMVALFVKGIQVHSALFLWAGIVGFVVTVIGLAGLFVVNPNEAKVLQLFGKYMATAKEPGLRWANPFYSKKAASLRVRNFETGKLKVNDLRGNPIEIAAVIVWRVTDTYEALFNVNDYVDFVHVQSEAALRNTATQYPYDVHEENEESMSGNTAEISAKIKGEVQERPEKAGVEVLEARISHLAYASEIAAAMLRRQQASAVVAARMKIVEGAVGMVEAALAKLSEKKIIELDEERKAAMVSNLMVVLCADRDAQPIVNTGSLYQ